MVVRCLESTFRGAGDFGHFFVRHLIVVPKVEHQPLFIRQFQYSLLEGNLGFISIEIDIPREVVEQIGVFVRDRYTHIVFDLFLLQEIE